MVKGSHFTKEQLKRLSDAHLGQLAWNKGIKGYLAGEKHYSFGKHRSKETIDKIKLNRKGKMTGSQHHQWKGGITSKNMSERAKFRRTIQKQVFTRDDYTCQICGGKGKSMTVDHIQSWAEYVELRFSIDNCRTLCQSCHYQITYGKPMPPSVRAWGHNFSKGGITKLD